MQDYTDLMSYLLRNRIIFVGARIDDQVGGGRQSPEPVITYNMVVRCAV